MVTIKLYGTDTPFDTDADSEILISSLTSASSISINVLKLSWHEISESIDIEGEGQTILDIPIFRDSFKMPIVPLQATDKQSEINILLIAHKLYKCFEVIQSPYTVAVHKTNYAIAGNFKIQLDDDSGVTKGTIECRKRKPK
jgi:hypothetical protein